MAKPISARKRPVYAERWAQGAYQRRLSGHSAVIGLSDGTEIVCKHAHRTEKAVRSCAQRIVNKVNKDAGTAPAREGAATMTTNTEPTTIAGRILAQEFPNGVPTEADDPRADYMLATIRDAGYRLDSTESQVQRALQNLASDVNSALADMGAGKAIRRSINGAFIGGRGSDIDLLVERMNLEAQDLGKLITIYRRIVRGE
jgi:hypothetical protein